MSNADTRVFFITGASSGFGRALAEAALARGDRAVLAARRADSLNDLAGRYPDHALAHRLDITDSAAITQAVATSLQKFGRIDVLANIAGSGSLGAAEAFSLAQLRQQMEVNFFAATEMTRAVLPAMRAAGRGHILTVTSVGGLIALPGFALYCASKFALEGWSEAVQQELAPLGIRLTLIEPGAFRTEFVGAGLLRPEQPIDAYAAVVKPVEDYLLGSDGKQPGDPVRAAEAMLAVVDSPEPPRRLLLGADGIGLWEQADAERHAELNRWRALGEDTAFEGATITAIGN